MKKYAILLALTCCIFSLRAASVIFIHPDGAGLPQWQALRFLLSGPDGETNWDKLPNIAVYRGHMSDCLTATSNAGAVAHAYGVRLHAKSFGLEKDSSQPPVSSSGRRETLMQEAVRRGLRTGLINSGSIIEPGTAVFVSAAQDRKMFEEITLQVLESGVDIILSGGERWMLPEGVQGKHGPGARKDRRNLISEAESRGYTIVYDAQELKEVPASTQKLLGVFASEHTFNDKPLDELLEKNSPLYKQEAPTLAEMLSKALEIFSGQQFFLVVEEEGSDNFGNVNNAPGVLEALRRADEAIGLARNYLQRNEDILIITASDSVAGGWDVIGLPEGFDESQISSSNYRDQNGAPYGLDQNNNPFLSAPDAQGKRHKFIITWGSLPDTSGGILARAEGAGSEQLRGTIHNTDIYRIMRSVLIKE